MTISITFILKEKTKITADAFWHGNPSIGESRVIASVDLDKHTEGRATIQTDSPANLRRFAAACIKAAELGEALEAEHAASGNGEAA